MGVKFFRGGEHARWPQEPINNPVLNRRSVRASTPSASAKALTFASDVIKGGRGGAGGSGGKKGQGGKAGPGGENGALTGHASNGAPGSDGSTGLNGPKGKNGKASAKDFAGKQKK